MNNEMWIWKQHIPHLCVLLQPVFQVTSKEPTFIGAYSKRNLDCSASCSSTWMARTSRYSGTLKSVWNNQVWSILFNCRISFSRCGAGWAPALPQTPRWCWSHRPRVRSEVQEYCFHSWGWSWFVTTSLDFQPVGRSWEEVKGKQLPHENRTQKL